MFISKKPFLAQGALLAWCIQDLQWEQSSTRWKGDGGKENRGTSQYFITSLSDYNLSLQVLCCLLMHMNTAKISLRSWSTDTWGNFFLTARREIRVSRITSCCGHGQISEQRPLGEDVLNPFISQQVSCCTYSIWTNYNFTHSHFSQTNYIRSFLGNRWK